MKPSRTQDAPLFTLITDGCVYAPEELGRKDILIAGRVIARIADRIDLPEDFNPRVINAKGEADDRRPALVDSHEN